ncbi:hypothetical protein ACFL5O_00695 [Myxococcota bacterium]
MGDRIAQGLGIEAVHVHGSRPSELGLAAARGALAQAQADAEGVGLIIDCSTLPGDHSLPWSLANLLAHELGCREVMAFSTQGAGCAGLLVALRVANALLTREPRLGPALLVASDCVPAGGRSCLPISVMGDASSAVVLGAASSEHQRKAPRLLSVVTSTLGAHHAVVTGHGCPPLLKIDGRAFEDRILPLHFVMCRRILLRALSGAGRRWEDIAHLVYPNTSLLDRDSVVRALGLTHSQLCGPGPQHLGHAFASDLVLNFPSPCPPLDARQCLGLLAAGSGFTWGAAILGPGEG